MGYTHYYQSPKETYSTEAWEEFLLKVNKIIGVSIVPLANGGGRVGSEPTAILDEVILNGVGIDSHESFFLLINDTKWQFCKTARKPYDVVVTSILIVAQNDLNYRVSSDGTQDEWQEGLDTVHELFGDKYSTDFLNEETIFDYSE